MAGHAWDDWFEREEFIGQISDIRVQNLQVEREVVQKRTFTRWINLHLEKCNPPIEVHDLFQDIQDGHILMALLEELSGCKLLHGFKKSSHRIFRLNNIAKVLAFLEERNVKLVSIDAADVADGNSSIILGLIWNIILFFQIKELTGNIRSQFPSSTSLSSIPTGSDVDISNCATSPDERELVSRTMREQSKTIKKLLQWVQKRTRKYGVAVQDFGKSWTSGLAFLAVIKSIDPSLIDMRKALLRSARENLENAFRIAHYSLGIPRLLEPEDVTINATDEHSIITYVSQFLEHFSGKEEPEESFQIIERSVSMGQLNLSTDPENRRNGAHRSRVRERSCMFQRDNVPPPTKILKSSMSEDRSALSCQFTPLAASSRSTENILADATHLENISSIEAEENKEPAIEVLITSLHNSPKLDRTESLTDFSVPDCITTNSLLCDSAVGSADSWTESDLGVMSGKFCESQSDGSLCDSGVIWDVYHATPVEVTPCDEGFVPPTEESDPNGQSWNNERIDSMRSLETAWELIQGVHEKMQVEVPSETEANHKAHNQEVALNQVLDNSKTELTEEVETKQVDTNIQREPSFGLYVWPEVLAGSGAGDLQKIDQANQSCLSLNTELPLPDDFSDLLKQHSVEESLYINHECPLKTGDAFSSAGQMNVPPGDLTVRYAYDEFAVKTRCQKTHSPIDKEREDPRSWIVKERDEEFVETQDKPDKEDSRDNLYSQEISGTDPDGTLVNTSPADQEGAPSISVFSISSKTDNQYIEKTCDPESQTQARDEVVQQSEITVINSADADVLSPQYPDKFHYDYNSDDKNPVEVSSCLIAENVKLAASEPVRDMDNWHFDDKDECNKTNTTNVDKCVPGTKATKDLSDFKQECDVTPTHSQIVNTYKDFTGWTSPLDQEVQPENTAQDSAKGKLSDSEKTMFNPVNSELYEPLSKSKNMDYCDSDLDQSSPTEDLVDSIEPMDLFYPDKEDPVFTEPSYNELQSWPSVLSVAALQPAPTSEMKQNDQPFNLMGEDLRNEVDLIQNKVITNMNEEAFKASTCQEQCISAGERLWDDDIPADGSDINKTMRDDPKSSNRQESSEIVPVLYHRQQPCPVEPVDIWDAVTVKVTTKDDDGAFWCSDSGEFYLLLLLWLVLYCFWLLPQMDLKALPSLLLSINH